MRFGEPQRVFGFTQGRRFGHTYSEVINPLAHGIFFRREMPTFEEHVSHSGHIHRNADNRSTGIDEAAHHNT